MHKLARSCSQYPQPILKKKCLKSYLQIVSRKYKFENPKGAYFVSFDTHAGAELHSVSTILLNEDIS